MAAAPETDWSRAAGLSLSDLTTIHRYLFAVAFISAYWDVHADLARRNKAASTASLLLAGLGLDPEAVLKRLLRYEEVWRLGMMSERLVPPFPGPTASTS